MVQALHGSWSLDQVILLVLPYNLHRSADLTSQGRFMLQVYCQLQQITMDQLNRGFTDNSNFSRYANLSDVEPVIHHSDKKQQEITKRDVGVFKHDYNAQSSVEYHSHGLRGFVCMSTSRTKSSDDTGLRQCIHACKPQLSCPWNQPLPLGFYFRQG